MKRQTGFGWWVREGSDGEPEYLHWTGDMPSTGGPWVAMYNPRRRRGIVYTPYNGSSDWVMSANKAMANDGRATFERFIGR